MFITIKILYLPKQRRIWAILSSIKTIQNRMRRLLRLSGLNETLTPHSLRHTHTSLLAEAGVGIHEIMERLGHQDDEITKRVYLHVTKTMKKEAAQKFSKLMDDL
ncbi:tyrosine-type recombinase/integrase [Cohnella sp.]|uniref:tyrosine-type recombinase/integrase n=1 Tax=Cohnella sp. TaxID=1883426 RepID=UPI00356661BF